MSGYTRDGHGFDDGDDGDTSLEAAQTLSPGNVAQQKAIILEALGVEPASIDGIYAGHLLQTGPTHDLVELRKRATELKNEGMIRKTGETEDGLKGKRVAVWEKIPPEERATERAEIARAARERAESKNRGNRPAKYVSASVRAAQRPEQDEFDF